jgi:hypothetical protein
MKIVYSEEEETVIPVRPYFIPTFAGKGLDSQPDDAEYHYDVVLLQALTFITETFPSGYIYTVYNYIVSVGGGTPPYTFSISKGALPPGLTLDTSTGKIFGYPTSIGGFQFTIKIQDSFYNSVGVKTPASVEKEFLIIINDDYFEPLGITNYKDLGVYRVGMQIVGQFYAVGGKPPYTWKVDDLPDGVSYDTTGKIYGSALVPNVYSIPITVTDSKNPPNVKREIGILNIQAAEYAADIPPIPPEYSQQNL